MWEKARFVLVVATIGVVCQTQADDDKWKWKSSGRSIDNRTPALFRPQHDYIQSQRPLPQYEVGEETEGIQPRPISKPNDFRPPKDYLQSQASTALQDDPVDEERLPVNRYPENRPGPFGNNRPDNSGFFPGDRPGSYPNDRYPSDRYPPNRYPNEPRPPPNTDRYGIINPDNPINRPYPRPPNTDRYGIINPDNPINRPYPRPPNPDRYGIINAGNPINRPYPGQNVGQIDRDPTAILTGPVPSWQREPAIKNYDRCKCSSKLNCNSPGISFGHCDVGKQYCCYNSRGNPFEGGAAPQEPTHSAEQGVLVGPGGPTGIIGRPGSRPGRPSFGNRGPSGGVLPYPGGPNTPFHSAENGVLIGPGGPFDFPAGRPPQSGRPYPGQNPYYRSNQKKED